MAQPAFDTFKFVKKLQQKGGFTTEQAQILYEAQRDVLFEALDTSLATKNELIRVESSLKADIVRVEHELKSDIKSMDGKFRLLYWMNGLIFLLLSSVAGHIFFRFIP